MLEGPGASPERKEKLFVENRNSLFFQMSYIGKGMKVRRRQREI
jgi:hypothetical protein